MTAKLNLGPASFQVVAYPGDDLEIRVILSDFTTGPIVWAGATITATIGGTAAATVDSSTDGLLVLSLSEAQTTSLGAGSHTFILRVQTGAGVTSTYIDGTVYLLAAGAVASARPGLLPVGLVGDVVVAVG